MLSMPRSRRSIGRQTATPPRLAHAAPTTGPAPQQALEPSGTTAAAPDAEMTQAKRDIDAGQVDTDMRATPGLDATLRAKLVPGPGGKPPASGG